MREVREAKPALQATLLGCGDLGSEEVVQELGVARLLLLGLLEGSGELFGDSCELQVGQVGAQLLVGGASVHRATLAIRAY